MDLGPDRRQEARLEAAVGPGERWLCVSWAVAWEWNAGESRERCMGGDSLIVWGR